MHIQEPVDNRDVLQQGVDDGGRWLWVFKFAGSTRPSI